MKTLKNKLLFVFLGIIVTGILLSGISLVSLSIPFAFAVGRSSSTTTSASLEIIEGETSRTTSSVNIIEGDSSGFRALLGVVDSEGDILILDDTVEELQLTKEIPEITILSGQTALNSIIIPIGITPPPINFESIIDRTNFEEPKITIPNQLDVDISTNSGNVMMKFPEAIQISSKDSSWDGRINLPTPKDVASVVAPTTGTINTVTSVFEIGSNDNELTFSKPVRIVLEGHGGENAAFSRSGQTFDIGINCSGDDETTVTNQLGGTGECKITVGNDLIIWTFHFTSFFTYKSSSSSPSPSPGPSGGGGGGGGVGGGLGEGLGGVLAPTVKIYEISYDVCEDNLVRVIAGSDGIEPPNVKLRTSLTGMVKAELISSITEDLQIVKYLYEAPIDKNEDFFIVIVEDIGVRIVSHIKESIDISQCSETITILHPEEVIKPSGAVAPKIEGGSTFIGMYNSKIFNFDYKLDSGKVTDFTVNEASKSVTFVIDGNEGGKLTLAIPHILVSADDNEYEIVDTKSQVPLEFDVIESAEGYVILQILLPKPTSSFTIIGTSVIPEFETITLSILFLSLLTTVILTRKIKWRLNC